jgi:excisionase family DNA binding protein
VSESDFLTTHQAAERLGIHVQTVHLWLRQGRFPHAQRLGWQWLIPARDVETVTRPTRGWPPGRRRKHSAESED